MNTQQPLNIYTFAARDGKRHTVQAATYADAQAQAIGARLLWIDPRTDRKARIKEATKADELKDLVLSYAWDLLNKFEEDITSGIDEGIYLKEDNLSNLKMIDDAKKAFREFAAFRPDVYVYVKGGLVQGASANCAMGFDVFDADGEERESEEEHEKFIEENTKDGTLIPIF